MSGSIADFVNDKLTDESPGGAADTRKKFVVMVDVETKLIIDNLSKATRTGKIELASQILDAGLREAARTVIGAGKMNEDFSLVGVEEEGSEEQPEDLGGIEDESGEDF